MIQVMPMVQIMTVGNLACGNLSSLNHRELEETKRYSRTVSIPKDAPAVEVVRLMEAMSSPLFLVQDENQSVIGVLARDWMLRRISDYRGTEFSTLSEAIENLSNDPNEIARGFHHEWLTEDRIDLLFCPNGYYVVDNPCLDHGAF